jgi:hypothetical protein
VPDGETRRLAQPIHCFGDHRAGAGRGPQRPGATVTM